MMTFAVFIIGTVIGSFLNVCIFRIPEEGSVLWPASHCPRCETPIASYDNIPLISYIVLLGRCRRCHVRISPRYPLVETLGGISAVASFAAYGVTPSAAITFAFLCSLIVVTFIDIDHQIIPDVISLPGIVLAFLASAATGTPGWRASLAGLFLGGGILWLIAEVYYRITGREGMGGGDIKLLAMIGAFLGWRAVPVTLALGSLSGSVVGITIIAMRRGGARIPIPFGPFLAAGAVCALFFGDALLTWYLHLANLTPL